MTSRLTAIPLSDLWVRVAGAQWCVEERVHLANQRLGLHLWRWLPYPPLPSHFTKANISCILMGAVTQQSNQGPDTVKDVMPGH